MLGDNVQLKKETSSNLQYYPLSYGHFIARPPSDGHPKSLNKLTPNESAIIFDSNPKCQLHQFGAVHDRTLARV